MKSLVESIFDVDELENEKLSQLQGYTFTASEWNKACDIYSQFYNKYKNKKIFNEPDTGGEDNIILCTKSETILKCEDIDFLSVLSPESIILNYVWRQDLFKDTMFKLTYDDVMKKFSCVTFDINLKWGETTGYKHNFSIISQKHNIIPKPEMLSKEAIKLLKSFNVNI